MEVEEDILSLLKQHERLGSQILRRAELPNEVADAIGGSGRAAVQYFQQIQRERMMQSAQAGQAPKPEVKPKTETKPKAKRKSRKHTC